MKASDIPAKFPIPFGDQAVAPYIRPVPQNSQVGIVDGAASLQTGFPPLNFVARALGGVPPFGEDFNGLLNQDTAWARWQAAGGAVPWDSTFASGIGGYPKGAIVAAAEFGFYWLCAADDNASNPDTGGANWIGFSLAAQARIVTASGAFAMTIFDQAVGLNRVTSPAVSSTTLPTVSVGRTLFVEDLAANFNQYPVTVSPSPGTTFAGGATSFTCNVNRQCAAFRFYGSNLWSVKA